MRLVGQLADVAGRVIVVGLVIYGALAKEPYTLAAGATFLIALRLGDIQERLE